jgi:hypothetical protein
MDKRPLLESSRRPIFLLALVATAACSGTTSSGGYVQDGGAGAPPIGSGGLTGAGGTIGTGGSTARDGAIAGLGCDGLELTTSAGASIKSYADAVTDLGLAVDAVNARFVSICNRMNADLGLDTTQTSADNACGVLNAYVRQQAAAGVIVTVNVAFACSPSVSTRAACQALCAGPASCDLKAKCEPGKLEVGCSGTCSGACDVSTGSVDCAGDCQGTCEAVSAVACAGTCDGTCAAPSWEGTCDTGCTAGFSGTCGGMCNGRCDGRDSAATACGGKCEGTCSAKATGTCAASCTGRFSGGRCTGQCTGKCTVDAGANCTGKCTGKCSVLPPSATCSGICTGGFCSVEITPASCTGTLNCNVSPECMAGCEAQARANADCPPASATVEVLGNLKLQQAIEASIGAFGAALNATLALRESIAGLASESQAAFSALGSVNAAASACLADKIRAMADVSAKYQVAVSASASLGAR